MIKMKDGVCFHNDMFSYPAMMFLIKIVAGTAPPQYDPTITAGCDGKHKNGSKHYVGKALDWRTRDFPTAPGCNLNIWVSRIENALGPEYFVLLEADHLHIQWNG